MRGVAVAFALMCACGHRSRPEEPRRARVEVIAHRGASTECPENTMAAFQKAFERGADRVELDVQLSRDGELVVLHDTTLDRTTDGSGPLRTMAWADLSRLDAGGWFSARYTGERLPRLRDVIEWSRGRLPLNVELKLDSERPEPAEARALAQAAAQLILSSGTSSGTIVSSFDAVAAAEMRRQCPSCEVALLWNGDDSPSPFPIVEGIGAQALHLPLDRLDPDLVRRAAELELPLRVYTVNSRSDLERALLAGAVSVFTDRPADVGGWLAASRP